MSTRCIALAACVALFLAACAIGKPIPMATTYVVEPRAAQVEPVAARRADTLRMGNVRVAAAYAGNALVYRMDDVQYTPDPYHAFIAEPGAMFGNRIAEWLDRSGPFQSVAQPGSARPAAFVLDATVTELYGDFRKGQPPAAVLAVQFALIDQVSARPNVTHECTLSSRIAIPRASPDALVQGYGEALTEILTRLVTALDAASAR